MATRPKAFLAASIVTGLVVLGAILAGGLGGGHGADRSELPAAEDSAPVAPPAKTAGQKPLFRITGTIGRQPVDLIVAPVAEEAAREVPWRVSEAGQTSPPRTARLRAAKMPPITQPVAFDTPEADAIVSALEVYPADNPWNQAVSDWPVHPNSAQIIASIGGDKPLRYNPDMAYVLAPADQKRVEVKLVGYSEESDKGPYPVPPNAPIEGWPAAFQRDPKLADATLDDVQRDRFKQGGDRHCSVVDPVNRMLYEFYQMRKTDEGWEAAQASIFDLKTNALRPDGWTSADAAGLPIFPAIVRYDELQRGLVEHAMRVTVRRSRRAYVAPATHHASQLTDERLPRMGERLRLKRDFDLSGFSPPVQAILKGLKQYGMFVADNGIEWAISVAPDPRIPDLHDELRRIKGSAFEVVAPPR